MIFSYWKLNPRECPRQSALEAGMFGFYVMPAWSHQLEAEQFG